MASALKQFDRVVLTTDLPQCGLAAGDVGTIVDVYDGGRGFEVEFFSLTGDTVAVETVMAEQVRAIVETDVMHARRRAG